MIRKVALIVDDSKLAQFVLRKMLRDQALAVDSVESAEDAITYLLTKKPDVIFMDHTMPGMDGLQAVKVIKENPETASIPIMMYTSKSDGVFVNQARELGAFEVLPKELKSVELQKVLDKLALTHKPLPKKELSAAGDMSALSSESLSKATLKRSPLPLDTIDVDSVDDLDEVSRLVKDAEAAFEKETLKQFVQQELQKQQLMIAQKFDYISQNLDYLRDENAKENDAQRFNFNNLFWPLFSLSILVFLGFMYYHQSQSVENIRSLYQESLSSINQKVITSDQGGVVSDPSKENREQDRVSSSNNNSNNSISEIISVMSLVVNNHNTVAYGDVFLDEAIIEKLEAMLLPLSRAGFFGEIGILVHAGNFCLSSNSAGSLVLPKESVSVGDCLVVESVAEGERLSTAAFRDVVEGINNADNGLTVSIVSAGSAQPVVPYPDANSMLATEWNRVAQKNNRVEFIFQPFEN